MFKNKTGNAKTMKRFLISTTLLLIILIGFGCGNSDNILSPVGSAPGVLGEVKSNEEVFAAPPNQPKIYHGEGWIGPAGGVIEVHGNTKVIFPQGALDSDVNITVDVEVHPKENKIHYNFGPHGTFFNVPVRIEMSWGYLKKYDGPLQLWYLQDSGEWTLENPTIEAIDNNSCIALYSPDGSLIVYYLSDTGEWIPIEDATIIEDTIIETTNSRIIVYVGHFSEYYFPRR